MLIANTKFDIQNESGGVLTLAERSHINDILQIDLHLHFDELTTPENVNVSFSLPYHGVAAILTPFHIPNDFYPHPDWNPTTNSSRLSVSSPVLHCAGYDDLNCYTVALSDVQTPVKLSVGVCEETGELLFRVALFTAIVTPLKDYHTILYIDKRKIPYYDALHDLEVYWQVVNDLAPCSVPEDALHPLYSFWYSYHQNFTTDEIIAECKRAKALGMKTVILDDGWQTEDNNRGYAFCGDWEIAPSKIPDIHTLVDAVHALDMKIVFWFSVPFVGKHAKNYEQFKGMYLDDHPNNPCLDPRFPAVREFLIGKWVRAMKEWDLDGLKLDFIDSMGLTPHSQKNDPRMDEVSLEKGIEKLLREAYNAITAIKPNALIEYRQGYVGPTIQAYGNMLRVCDCPNDAHSNRVRSMQLRLLTHTTAIHSDMLMWHKEESPEFAARQISAIFFTVPQISVRLDQISKEQKEMLHYYLQLWEAHRNVLLHGHIIPHSPDCHFPMIEAIDEKEHFAVSYTKGILEITDDKVLIYINATEDSTLYVNFKKPQGVKKYRIFDCRGNLIKEASGAMCGIRAFDIPVSGVLEIY